jgi:CTP:molybdopterin cytidylyltransferase MocA
MTCDMPAVASDHLQALTASGVITASCYAGRNGVPAYFPRAAFSELARLSGDSGARELLRTAPAIVLPHGEFDVDTPYDLAMMVKSFG